MTFDRERSENSDITFNNNTTLKMMSTGKTEDNTQDDHNKVHLYVNYNNDVIPEAKNKDKSRNLKSNGKSKIESDILNNNPTKKLNQDEDNRKDNVRNNSSHSIKNYNDIADNNKTKSNKGNNMNYLNDSTKANTMDSSKQNSMNEKTRNGNYNFGCSNNKTDTETERGSGPRDTTPRVLINENANTTSIARNNNSHNSRSVWNMIDD